MAIVTIKTAPLQVRRDVIFCNNLIEVVKNNIHKYTSVGPFIAEGPISTAEEVAEAMFDLTNNPSRQSEREQVYGNGPSLSVGDVVVVNDVSVVCCSMGWERL